MAPVDLSGGLNNSSSGYLLVILVEYLRSCVICFKILSIDKLCNKAVTFCGHVFILFGL